MMLHEALLFFILNNISRLQIQEIQRLMGHSNINTTMKYICLDESKVQASYKQFIA